MPPAATRSSASAPERGGDDVVALAARAPPASSRMFCGRSSTTRIVALIARAPARSASIAAICAGNSRTLIGFSMYPSNPAGEEAVAVVLHGERGHARRRAARRSPGSARSRASASTPSIPGSWTSMSTRCGRWARRARSPSSPVRRRQRPVAGVLEQVAHELQVAWVVLHDEDQAALGHASTRRDGQPADQRDERRARSSSPFCARWLMRPASRSRSARVISLWVSTRIGTAAVAGSAAQRLDDGEPVHVRHQQIQQHDAGSPLADELHPLRAVSGADDREALGREHRLDEVELERIVVDHNDRSRVTTIHVRRHGCGRPRTTPAAAASEPRRCRAGIANPNVLPAPSPLCIHIRPPCSSTIRSRQREPEAGSLRARARVAPAALERLEDARLLGLGDADAGVAHLDLEPRPRRAARRRAPTRPRS